MTQDEFDVLLIEDNPGDARLIEELLNDGPQRSGRRTGDGADVGGVSSFRHADSLTAGLETLEEHDIDVVLLDLGLPESTGLETLETVLERVDHLPIVVLTGLKNEEVGVEAVQRGAQEYLLKDEITSTLLRRSLRYAIERQGREQRLAYQREQLEALNSLNAIVRGLNEALVQQSTREEIEQQVCDRLTASDSYRFAWIGSLDRNSDEVVARAAAGVEGYLDEVTITADEEETANGPTGRAIRTGEIQVTQHITEDGNFEPWRETVAEYGFESSAAIPIVHEGVRYGVLNVYSERPAAFDDQEYEVISQLGGIIGHAIAAIERKETLMSDDDTELEFQIRDMLGRLGDSGAPGGPVTFERTVPTGDDTYLAYGTVDDVEALDALTEEISYMEDANVIGEDFGVTRFELRLSEPPLISILAAQGGHVQRAVIEDGDYNLVVHVPSSADVRRLTEAVQDAYPEAEVTARRRTPSQDRSTRQIETVIAEELTDRQRTVLETAYFAGFFNWPRDSSGEEIAESLDITASTFHQHLRLAESKLLEALFVGPDESD